MTTHRPANPPRGHPDHMRPRWPAYLPDGDPPPARLLCLLDADHRLWPEGAGREPVRVASWAELGDLLYAWDAAVWTVGPVVDVLGVAWLAAMLDETHDRYRAARERDGRWRAPMTPPADPPVQWSEPWLHHEEAAIIKVSVHRGSSQRFIASCHVWGGLDAPHTPSQRAHWLRLLRDLFDLMGCGVVATPGGLGEAAMREGWGAAGADPRRHFPPARRCAEVLTREGIGGRVDAYQRNRTIYHAIELDKTSAYPSYCVRLPCGQPHYLGPEQAARWLLPAPRSEMGPCATWYGYVAVRLLEDIHPADRLPIAIRAPTEEDPHRLIWPHTAGTYCVWTWKECVDYLYELIAAGYPIEVVAVDEAWVWREWTDQLAPWARRMDGLRRDCTDHEVGQLVKQCAVAGVGHLGMAYVERELIGAEEADPTRGDMPWRPQSLPDCGLYVREKPVEAANPIHWAVYTWMRCNLDLTRLSHEEYLRGNPAVAIYTDAALFAGEPAAAWSPAPAMGGYKRIEYPVAVVVKAGVMLAPEKIRAPGVPKADSRQLLRMGEHPPPRRGRRRDRLIDPAERQWESWLRVAYQWIGKRWPDEGDSEDWGWA